MFFMASVFTMNFPFYRKTLVDLAIEDELLVHIS